VQAILGDQDDAAELADDLDAFDDRIIERADLWRVKHGTLGVRRAGDRQCDFDLLRREIDVDGSRGSRRHECEEQSESDQSHAAIITGGAGAWGW
jgi:hypothetical protein